MTVEYKDKTVDYREIERHARALDCRCGHSDCKLVIEAHVRVEHASN